MNRLAILLALFVAGSAEARKSASMTPVLKASLNAIGEEEKAALQPLRDKEFGLRRQRNDLASAIVKVHKPIKSKEEAKVLSAEIAADPAVAASR